MICGIGIDLTLTSRVKMAIKKSPRLMERIYTDPEKKYCLSKANPWPHFAARFAAKEAFIKAWGTVVLPKEIETIVAKGGRPSLKFYGKTAELLKKNRIKRCHLSLSHEGDYAIASVLLEV